MSAGSRPMVALAAGELDRSVVGEYVEIECHGCHHSGGVSDVVVMTVPAPHVVEVHDDGIVVCLSVEPHTHVFVGGRRVEFCHEHTVVRVAAPADPCDGTPMNPTPAPAPAVSPLDTIADTLASQSRARGWWLTALLALALYVAGIAVSIAGPALSGATIAAWALILSAAALAVRLVVVMRRAGALTREVPCG